MVRTDFQESENVMKLIPQTEVKLPKQPRYTSKYRPLVLLEFKKDKCAHRTLGVPQVSISKEIDRSLPCNKLDKKPAPFKREKRKPPLPAIPVKLNAVKREENDLPDLPKDPFKTARIDHKKENILNAKRLKPPESKKRTVHTRFGDTFDLLPSGLYPIYIRKKGYGRVPKNIVMTSRYNAIQNVTKLTKEKYVKPSIFKQGCRCITAEEREQLLTGLKKRWNEMMMQFQRLPFVIDTLPKAQRKTQMERDLEKLEKEIDMIKRHPYIYVYSDDEE